MYEYFANQGFDLEAPIFNVEFQMHRPHLKAFGVQTVDDLLLNVNRQNESYLFNNLLPGRS